MLLSRGNVHPMRSLICCLMLSACGVDAEPEFETDTPLNRSLIQVVALGADLNEAGFRDVRGYGVDSQGRIWVASTADLYMCSTPMAD
jgi:hypothetical protein